MKKYKISKSNLKEFFGLFGKKKPQTLQSIIDVDPVMRKLDNEMEDIAKTFIPRIRKIKDTPKQISTVSPLMAQKPSPTCRVRWKALRRRKEKLSLRPSSGFRSVKTINRKSVLDVISTKSQVISLE